MKIRIDGVDYDAVDHRSANMLHLMELQQQSRRLVEGGLGMSRLERIMRSSVEYRRARKAWLDADADPDAEPEAPDDGILAIAILIFLSRRAGGDKVTFEDANDYRSIEFVEEPGDQGEGEGEAEADPTSPGPASPETPASDPADAIA